MAEQEEQEPEQLRLMKRMVELAEYQVELAKQRTEMSADRSRMSADRSRMSEDRSRMSEDRSRMSADRSRMSADRSQMSQDRSTMSAQRSEMSEDRSYLNAERTLSVWTRTSLALMVFGIAVDRFALLLRHPTAPPGQIPAYSLSSLTGAALVAFGILMVLATGFRFLFYARDWRRRHLPVRLHGPYLAFSFAMLTALFGIGLLMLMLVFS
ncbi:MAG: DUF202 domain-containing protein [Rhodanobacteraceae bacterium]